MGALDLINRDEALTVIQREGQRLQLKPAYPTPMSLKTGLL